MTHPRLATAVLLLVAVVAVGCGDGDGDGDSQGSGSTTSGLAGRFLEAADQAAAEAPVGPGEDSDPGGDSTPCFVLDADGERRVTEALGLAASESLDDSAYLRRYDGKATLGCSYVIQSDEEAPPVSILVEVTDDDLDAYVDGALDGTDPPEQLDRSAEGLDDRSVTGFAKDGFQQAAWLEDGVLVKVGAREQDVEVDRLFEALPVLVAELERVLGSG